MNTAHETTPTADEKLLKIRLSLQGRPIRTYAFNQDCVLVGRNPEAHVCLDNPGISRDHLKIDRTPGGYVVEDLNSANGTFLNDRRIRREVLAQDDVIRIGKFSLWVSLEDDRRRGGTAGDSLRGSTMGGTTVLTTGELETMIRKAKTAEPSAPPDMSAAAVAAAAVAARRARFVLIMGMFLSFVVGSVLGASVVWYLRQ